MKKNFEKLSDALESEQYWKDGCLYIRYAVGNPSYVTLVGQKGYADCDYPADEFSSLLGHSTFRVIRIENGICLFSYDA